MGIDEKKIEKVEVQVKQNQGVLLNVKGMYTAGDEEEIQILLGNSMDYMLYQYKDTDKSGVFHFCIYAHIQENIDRLKLRFKTISDCQDMEIVLSDFVDIKKIKRQIQKSNKTFILNGNFDENIFYNIESCQYDEGEKSIWISGWLACRFGKIDISDTYYEKVEVLQREDVVQAFEKEFKIDKDCGFSVCYVLRREPSSEDAVQIIAECVPYGRVVINLLCKNIKDIVNKQAGESKKKKNIFKEYKRIQTLNRMYGKEGRKYKEMEEELWLLESQLNHNPYIVKDFDIPKEWLEALKHQIKFTIVIECIEVKEKKAYFVKMLESLARQKYKNFEVVFIGENIEKNGIDVPQNIEYLQIKDNENFEMHMKGEWILRMDQEDLMGENFLGMIAEDVNENLNAEVVYADYDIYYKDEPVLKVERTEKPFKDENMDMAFCAVTIKKDLIEKCKSVEELYYVLQHNKNVIHDKRVAYHYLAVPDSKHKETTKNIAFYLTQYHETEENNKWWGEGFTEWSNVTRAIPMYKGHHQPRVPGKLGYYDLVEDLSIQYKQIEMAKEYNIYGFCYYYYWFEGKRLLRKPLDQFLENKELDFPYCICWANETWSRRWDGQEQEVLIKQVHNKNTDVEFIRDVIPMFKDPRYIRIDGKPLIVVYRIDLFPEPYQTIKRWRKICKENGIEDIHISVAQSFDILDHRIYGADSSVEFPPHKVRIQGINEKVLSSDSKFEGNIFDYEEAVANISIIKKRDYKLFTGAMLEWDNTARRMFDSNIFYGFSLEIFRKWLMRNHYYTKIYNDSPITFINAWNEWAEGSYLEPDEKYGMEKLKICQEVSKYK